MRTLKKWLIAFSLLISGIILAAALIPYVYKDELLDFLKKNINKNISAEVKFSDASLSLLTTFPNLGVHIDSLSVTGIEAFDGVTLYKAPKTSVMISLPSLLGKGRVPEIVSLSMQQPEINIIVLDTTRANYLITKEDTVAVTSVQPSWHLQLSNYELIQARITYRDYTMPMYMVLNNLDHSGKGDFTQDVFDLDTRSSAESISVEFDGITYLTKARALLNAVIQLNVPEESYTFSNNQFTLNALQGAFDGSFRFEGDDIITKLSFTAANQPFSHFLSLVPGAYTDAFDKVVSKGSASVSGRVDGLYSELKKSMPGFQIQVDVKDGYAKYPGMPMDISNANASVKIKALEPDYSDLSVDIPNFSVKMGANALSGKLLIDHAMAHQKVEGNLTAQLDLASLAQVFPSEAVKGLSGALSSNLSFKADVDDIKLEKYENIQFNGEAVLAGFKYSAAGNPPLSGQLIKLSANPENSTLLAKDLHLGRSDLDFTASLKNPLAVFTRHKEMVVDVSATSGLIDLNEWMTDPDPEASSGEAVPAALDDQMLKASFLFLKARSKKVIFKDQTLSDVVMNASLAANAMKINQISLQTGPSDMLLTGQVLNAYDYLFSNGVLVGNIELKSKKLDLNPFMQSAPAEPSSKTTPLVVPERTRLTLVASIDDLNYTNFNIRNLKTTINIHQESASISEMVADIFGGKVKLEGVYNSSNALKPEMSLRLDLLKIPYAQAISQMDMFKKVAPVASYIQGIFNTTLVMSGALDNNMSPDLSSLDASGYIETLKGSIKNCKPFMEVAGKLGLKTLQEIQLTDTKNWFEIKDGYLELKEFSKKLGEVNTTISGKHGIGKEMDYELRFTVPRSMLKKNTITQLAESGLSMLEKEAASLGLNINQGPEIFINVHLGGYLTKPSVKITAVSSGQGGISDVTEAAIATKVEAIRDSLEQVISRKKEELKDSLSDKASRELEKAKQMAEKEAQKALDSLKAKARDQVLNKADSLSKGVIPDSLRKKARDVLDKKSNEEVDKIKNKLKDFNPFKKKGQ
jgi:hypothetical protein